MNKRRITATTALSLVAAAVLSAAGAAQAGPNATQRPIADFVSAQGTHCLDDGGGGCILFIPPVPNYMGFSDPARGWCGTADYAGVANTWITAASGGTISFGTQISGTVTEKPRADGRAEVTVRLQTRNALVWVIDGCDDFATNPLLFGNRAQDVLSASAQPALGDVSLQVRFVNTAPGAALPDLVQLFFATQPDQEFPSFYAFAVNADGFPAEHIELMVTGQ